MDMNFADLKKEAAAVVDDTVSEAAKQVTHDLLGGSNSPPPSHQDDNAHTEHYFANEQKLASDLGFEHVDPQAFVQRMSAGAKEAQEQLDAKFAEMENKAHDAKDSFNDLLGDSPKRLAGGAQAMVDLTRDFMNAERGFGNEPAAFIEQPTKAASQLEEDLLGDFGGTQYAQKSPPTTDTESPSLSYTASPAKKNPVAAALKEQDNEKFISSEDLLSDFSSDHAKPVASAAVPVEEVPPPVPPHRNLTAEEAMDWLATKPNAQEKQPANEVKEVVQPKPSKEQKKPEKAAGMQEPKIFSVEEVFYKYGLDAWFKPQRLHPQVESLIYWRDVKKSGIVFGAGLTVLLAISCFSVISVFAYLSLITLVGTIAFRIYKTVMQAIQKTSEGHPFKEFLEFDLAISQDKVQNFTGVAVVHINGFIAELRRLFLVEDLVDSIKFGVILWVLTYVGAWLNGMTLVILTFVALFTLPKVYENNKQSVDTYLDLVRSKLTEITDKVKAAVPIGGVKKPIATESDKDK